MESRTEETVPGLPIRRVQRSRVGFMKGQIQVPDDFDTMGAEEIVRMFEGSDDESRPSPDSKV